MIKYLLVAKNTTPFDIASMRLFNNLIDTISYVAKKPYSSPGSGKPRSWRIYQFEINANKKPVLISAPQVRALIKKFKSGKPI